MKITEISGQSGKDEAQTLHETAAIPLNAAQRLIEEKDHEMVELQDEDLAALLSGDNPWQ